MTRTTDTGLSPSNNLSDDLKKRVEYAKGKKADVLVSMHLNSTGLGTAHGAEVYYPNANYNPGVGSEGKNLASKIQKELVGLGLTDRGIKIRNSGTNTLYPDGSLQDYYALIWQSKRAGFPAIIVEHAFIDNTSDYNKYLSSDEKLKALGIADAKGIAEAYGFAKGQWIQNDKGWWYQYADGSYAKYTWAAINGAWYHFDSDGYMQTGWFTEGTAKYYLDPVSGAMKTGWQLINNKWYYFNGGSVATSYNGLAQNEAGWWKITKGQVDFGYTGFAGNDAGIWYIINGAVAFDYTGTVDATIVSNGRAENHQHSWVHHEAEYREDFIPVDQLERNDYGKPIFPKSYSGVYERHYVCNQCKKDFGRDDHAAIIHLGESDFYTGCSNYSLERILMGAKKTELVSGSYDECSICGAVR